LFPSDLRIPRHLDVPLRRLAVLVLLALLAAAGAAADATAALRAGAAVTDITPQNGGTTLGFVRPDITVKGVRTRLTARALVLENGGRKVALIATDLGMALSKADLLARLQPDGFDHGSLLYTSTHTHSGPEGLDPWQLDQIAAAVREADARTVPARAGWGTNRRVLDVARNRSIEAYLANFGIDQFYGEGHPEDAPGGAASTRDETLRLLRVETTSGKPLAAWMSFPVHLTTTTPAVDLWDADIAAPATARLERSLGRRRHRGSLTDPGFVALYSANASGDLMPTFDDVNAPSTIDVLGRRIAAGARKVWNSAGRRLRRNVSLDWRITRACFCGQEVEPGKRVDSKPVFGLPFLGGSEDGASIFHEPVATEGRRLPAESADPVQGRKIIVPVPTDVVGIHEPKPEVHALRVGNRLLLGAPGEPTIQTGRLIVDAVRPVLPRGVRDVAVLGHTNDYSGYITTPEEYEMQHYEGGHTPFGRFSMLHVRDTFVALTKALREGTPAPEPSAPFAVGSADAGPAAVGQSGAGSLEDQPVERVARMETVEVGWRGTPGGVDRPVDGPHLLVERRARGRWVPVDSDLGLAFSWREVEEGRYRARYDIAPGVRPGVHRIRVRAAGYDLETRSFTVTRSRALIPTGAKVKRLGRGRVRVLVLASNPPPDKARSLLHRPRSPSGGKARVRVGGKRRTARWNRRLGGWAVTFRPRKRLKRRAPVVLRAGALRDGAGNTNGKKVTLRLGSVRTVAFPPPMGVGGGRTPGVGGEGSFPP
jgi:neutral ceramidase